MILMMLLEDLVPPRNTTAQQSKLQTIIPQWQHSGEAHKAFGYLSTIKLTLKGGQQTEWTFLALPYRRFESLFVTLLYCVDFE